MKKGFLLILLLGSICLCDGQTYAPAANTPGSTAIHKDSSVFVGWAAGCKVIRGLRDISNSATGFASVGDSSMATGKAISNGVVSLGDGGYAICNFNKPVFNGPGFDFAIFENSIDDSFLELAFVEVSSDGSNFFRFPSHSLTDTNAQTGSFGSTDPTKINNLAGKYRAGYGTPFDLSLLAGQTGLNINAITHIKVIDVVGTINPAFARRDSYNNKVNDPWPTDYPSSGFDLDAIGVINELSTAKIFENKNLAELNIFPNPSSDFIRIESSEEIKFIEVYDLTGSLILGTSHLEISAKQAGRGLRVLLIYTDNSVVSRKILFTKD